MLSIKNLHAGIEGKEILNGINLEIKAGEVHAIMGPNGSGKSTLSVVLAGRKEYNVTEGEVWFSPPSPSGDGTVRWNTDFVPLVGGVSRKNLLEMSPEDRAREGLFLAFQYPIEIPGVSTINFLKTAINELRVYKNLPPIEAKDFLKLVKEKQALVELTTNLANRSVNEGFSGGEKKRNEIFQMAMLEPALAILDETDSGLDIDALRIVANGVNKLRSKNNAFVVITHYQRLLNYIVPDFVHILYNGKIVKSGTKELAMEMESKGYDWIKQEVAVGN
ncbi:MAG: Fe-S cluster assembly ATPase SufC [Bacteroidota bacterium]